MPEQTDPTSHLGPSPLFSVVTAVHDVERFLDQFTGSLDAQTFPHAAFEVVAVDDGSTDDSRARLDAWASRTDIAVTVVTQENAGQGEARNNGVRLARGRWVTFPDPDDWLAPDYLQQVAAFLEKHPDTAMVATNRLIFLEGVDTTPQPTHPLAAFFADGDQLVDLTTRTDRFHGSAPAAFFRRDVLLADDVRFDPRIRPNFEDGHFCVQYLLAFEQPSVGFLASAGYVYRKRSDGSSTLQNKRLDPRHFTDVPRHGYLDALRRGAAATGGMPPVWLQQFVLYELSWYFQEDKAMSNAPTAGSGAVGAEFVAILAQLREHLQDWVIEQFDVRRFDRDWREILLFGLRQTPWASNYVVAHEYDTVKHETRLAYRFTGSPPEETFLVNGTAQLPHAHKVRSVDYFGQTLLKERIAWVPVEGSISVLLDGRIAELRGGSPGPNTVRRTFRAAPKNGASSRPTLRQRLKVRTRALNALADVGPLHSKFADAWTLMDRVHNADDNAERLFRYLRANEPGVNAWFVLDRDSADWKRLERDGHGDRLVHYGSNEWTVLLMNTRHFISSHIDRAQQEPRPLVWMRPPAWRYTFLQHGVIKDDISRWLNWKKIDLFVTSTPGEHESIVGDDTPYRFTSKEVKMTGLPRFDRLRELAGSTPEADRDLVLVAPTWRNWLSAELAPGETRRSVVDDFLDADYVRQWLAVVCSPALRDIAASSGKRVAFLPHPNIQPMLGELDLPAHVVPLTFEGQDVQRYFARSAALVTDYSSMAFNAAYVDRPVVYFQFDYDLAMKGGHLGREGYFDYRRDGFGPVVTEADDVVAALAGIGEDGWRPSAEHARRIAETFPVRDGRCCERTVAAIRALDAP